MIVSPYQLCMLRWALARLCSAIRRIVVYRHERPQSAWAKKRKLRPGNEPGFSALPLAVSTERGGIRKKGQTKKMIFRILLLLIMTLQKRPPLCRRAKANTDWRIRREGAHTCCRAGRG